MHAHTHTHTDLRRREWGEGKSGALGSPNFGSEASEKKFAFFDDGKMFARGCEVCGEGT